jgi:GntR family transcriptional repressor for pyruvate dehydrogenase complex
VSERPFEPLERSTVSERVRDDIHHRVVSGEIPPGTPLPAERMLAEQFGVARTSVREAIQGLVALGVIERRGNRSYVVERLPESELMAPDGATKSLRELLEARQVLELCLSEMAVSRATARERSDVLDLARRPAPPDLESLAIAGRQFHAAIAAACGNPVLVEVYGRVLDAVVGVDLPAACLLEGAEEDGDPAATITRVATEHLRIAEAFAEADEERMLREAAAHVGDAAGRLSSTLNRPGRPPVRGWEAWASRQRKVGS